MERASERKGATYHVGFRLLTGDAYRTELARLARFLKERGYKVRFTAHADSSPSLYVTLDASVGLVAMAQHADYIRLLESKGATLPQWARAIAHPEAVAS